LKYTRILPTAFLVATPQVFDLVLVTADERLLGLGDIKTLRQRLTIAF
jgi:hypothetical protein